MTATLRGRFCAHGIEGSSRCPDCHAEAAESLPCRCHKSHAYIDPWHAGHCCFDLYATCHPEEVAAWEEADKAYFPNGRHQH